MTALPARAAGDGLAARVIVLANRNDAGSVEIAEHYAAVRSVPSANIIALPMPTAETITWDDFISTIWDPLLAQLVHEEWIDAIPMDLTDAVGRRKYVVNGHRVAALVVCRGVPLRIMHDPARYVDTPPFTRPVQYRTNAAAVDSELSLLPQPNHPINAFVLNPLFQNDHPSELQHQLLIEVSRLDGPTVAEASALVDHALAAERDGLLGRAYVDLSDRDPIGNRWLENVATQLGELGFDEDVDRNPATLPDTTRIDAPALYFGWYAHDIDGPFALPGFRFPPGAIALHIHSYSAETLRSANSGWVGPFVARGVTATIGNVYEPYLQLTHRPDLLVRALARGADLVDAAYYSIHVLSWQGVLIGDPLYRPFAKSIEAQLRQLSALPRERVGYAVLRQGHRLDAAGHSAEAVAALRRELRERPSLAVAFALAQRLRMVNDRAGALAALTSVPVPRNLDTTDWALTEQAARLLVDCGSPGRAVNWWGALLAQPNLPLDLQMSWLPEAVAAAQTAHATTEAENWQAEFAELRKPVAVP